MKPPGLEGRAVSLHHQLVEVTVSQERHVGDWSENEIARVDH